MCWRSAGRASQEIVRLARRRFCCARSPSSALARRRRITSATDERNGTPSARSAHPPFDIKRDPPRLSDSSGARERQPARVVRQRGDHAEAAGRHRPARVLLSAREVEHPSRRAYHRGRATDAYEGARGTVRRFLNASPACAVRALVNDYAGRSRQPESRGAQRSFSGPDGDAAPGARQSAFYQMVSGRPVFPRRR